MDFTRVANFNSRLEAETAGHTLDSHRIPFMIKSDDAFGSRTSTLGAILFVPEDHAEEAREVLTGVIDSPVN